MFVEEGYCNATVYKRDQYRVSHRPGRHFVMHYIEDTCSRKAKYGDYCWQHKHLAPKKRSK